MTMSLQIKMATNHSCISRFHNPECSRLEMSKSNERSPIKQAVLIILKAPFTNIQRRHFGLELMFIPRRRVVVALLINFFRCSVLEPSCLEKNALLIRQQERQR